MRPAGLRLVDAHDTTWQPAAGEDGPQPHPAPRAGALLTLAQWHAVRETWPAALPPGLLLDNDDDVAALRDDLPRLALIALRFPVWTDGRAYSQARLLRSRLGWRGELRATGEVLVDMLPLLWRTGFDTVVLRHDQDPDDARRALAAWTGGEPGTGPDAGFPGRYQADAQPASRSGAQHPAPPQPAPGSAFALYARKRPGHAARVGAAVALLREAAQSHPGAVVQASSLGAEDMVLTDLIVRHRLPIAVAMIDTGRLHAETLALHARAQAHFGITIEVHRPAQPAVIAFVTRHGPQPMFQSVALRQACCALRKQQPLQALLDGRSAWVTGLRRGQSDQRAAVEPRQHDATGREKFSPLADWHWEDVWQHLLTHRVPYHPLHDAFMPSIGCAPCTRAITTGEDFRAGRWWWEQDGAKECGLHPSATSA